MSYSEFNLFFPEFNELLEKSLSQLEKKEVKKDTTFLHYGDTLDNLYFVLEGRARVFRPLYNGKDFLYSIYRPGDIIGDLEFFTAERLTGTVRILDHFVTYKVPFNSILNHKAQFSKTIFALGCSVAKKLRASSSRSAMKQNYSLESILGATLLEWPDVLDKTQLGRKELAASLGCSYRHLSRILQKFVEEGALEKQGTNFSIKDLEEVKKIAAEALIEKEPLKK